MVPESKMDARRSHPRRLVVHGALAAVGLAFALGAGHPNGCCYYFDDDHCAVNHNGCPDGLVCSDCTAEPDNPPYRGCVPREEAEAQSVEKGRNCIVWPEDEEESTGTTEIETVTGPQTGSTSTGTTVSSSTSSTSGTTSDPTSSTTSGSTDTDSTGTTADTTGDQGTETGTDTDVPETCGDGLVDPGEECDCGWDQLECELDDEASATRTCYQCLFDRYVFLAPAAPATIFAGVHNIDLWCQTIAEQFGDAAISMSTRPFYVWISDADGEMAPENRFHKHDGRYVLPSGTLVAEGWEGLTGAPLKNTISETVAGNPFPEDNPYVWSNVKSNGALYGADDCNAWSPPDLGSDGAVGRWTDPFKWSNDFVTQNCETDRHLYCFEQATNTEWIP